MHLVPFCSPFWLFFCCSCEYAPRTTKRQSDLGSGRSHAEMGTRSRNPQWNVFQCLYLQVGLTWWRVWMENAAGCCGFNGRNGADESVLVLRDSHPERKPEIHEEFHFRKCFLNKPAASRRYPGIRIRCQLKLLGPDHFISCFIYSHTVYLCSN